MIHSAKFQPHSPLSRSPGCPKVLASFWRKTGSQTPKIKLFEKWKKKQVFGQGTNVQNFSYNRPFWSFQAAPSFSIFFFFEDLYGKKSKHVEGHLKYHIDKKGYWWKTGKKKRFTCGKNWHKLSIWIFIFLTVSVICNRKRCFYQT